jgi:hypothetical protein
MKLILCALLALVPVTVFGQGRTVRKIPKAPDKQPASTLGVTPEQCAATVQQIARTWGSNRLRDALHPSFPNAPELMDSIRQATLRGTNVALQVEAIQGTKLTQSKDGNSADCVADVSTRLQFDDPKTGQRRTGPVGRAQWRIRFERTPR